MKGDERRNGGLDGSQVTSSVQCHESYIQVQFQDMLFVL